MTTFEKEKIIEQLGSLKNLPQIKEVKALRQRLERELERFAEKQVIEKTSKNEVSVSTNVRRSSKLTRYWRYVRLVRDSFPNLKIKTIRSELKRRHEQGDSEIPDAVWQNPSP